MRPALLVFQNMHRPRLGAASESPFILLQAKSNAPAGEVTEAEIAAFMRAAGPIPSSQLTSHFKKRVVTMEQRKAFTAKVKRLAKLQEVEPGRKCIVLR